MRLYRIVDDLKSQRKATPCAVGGELLQNAAGEGHHPRQATTRGTQRLYIRLNTLHYLLTHIHSLDKALSLPPRITRSTHRHSADNRGSRTNSSSYFELANLSFRSACQYVSEVAAYRLIFLDSNSVFYESLYLDDVANARITPTLQILKQNLTLLSAIPPDKAQAAAVKEVMRASFEAYLMVLLAGGSSRVFSRSDRDMIADDFDRLKSVFCTCGDGLLQEEVVEKEAETVEGVIALMGERTEQLIEDFSIVTCEASGIAAVGSGQNLPMPRPQEGGIDLTQIPSCGFCATRTTANQFLKRAFQLPKRR